MILQIPIETDHLCLKTLSPDAADGPYLEWMNDPEVLRWLDANAVGTDNKPLRDFIEKVNGEPQTLLLGIHRTDEDRHVGNIKLAISTQHRRGDLGIILGDKASWGKGFAAEAITALSGFAKSTLDLDRLFAGCVTPNRGAVIAFKKAGFEEEGLLRQHWFNGLERFDVVLLGKVLRAP